VDVRLQPGINPIETLIDIDTILAALDDQVRTKRRGFRLRSFRD
jgi:hypothetical protein